MTDDVKKLLGRAFDGEEPPLRIDRDAVLNAGRKRLRRKRVFEAGSVVAAVVVAAVGAATLTNLVGNEPDKMPPAASTTQYAPPGPDLPVTSTDPRPPSAGTTTRVSPSIGGPNKAAKLTQLLYMSGIVREDYAKPVSNQSGPPAFKKVNGTYVYEADLFRPAVASGHVMIVVDPTPSRTSECAEISKPYTDCQISPAAPFPVYVSHYETTNGERGTRATGLSAYGARVTIEASNLPLRDAKAAVVEPPNALVVLSDGELVTLVARAGLGD
jgi:hypothetical protein